MAWEEVSAVRSRTSSASETSPLADCSGQASVEAALLLPTVLLVLAVLLQPACLLYTRFVMTAAAAEAVRVQATAVSDTDVDAFVRRRLAAVPEVFCFHVGGAGDWQVSVSGPDDKGVVSVEVVGHARPLPLIGSVTAALSETDGTGVVLRVSVDRATRTSWEEGSYEDWVGIWGSS